MIQGVFVLLVLILAAIGFVVVVSLSAEVYRESFRPWHSDVQAALLYFRQRRQAEVGSQASEIRLKTACDDAAARLKEGARRMHLEAMASTLLAPQRDEDSSS
jgi:hypothetical protein